jgi:hypothetical protein
LIADQASIASYLAPTPAPESTVPGDVGGFILAVDADFDAEDRDPDRAEESPGFDGSLRVLGSLLWDDLAALMAMQTQGLEELWGLAMDHPLKIYVGPVTGAQQRSWKSAGEAQ